MAREDELKPLNVRIGTVDEKSAKNLVLGRAELAERFWVRLKAGSIRVLAERRMGKTWFLWLTYALCPQSAATLIFDAEKCGTAPEFVWQLNDAMHRRGLIADGWWGDVRDWFRRVYQRLQGQTAGSSAIPKLDPWTSLLEDTCRHYASYNNGRLSVLMFDELPFFLDKLIEAEHAPDAIQLLDTLRALRQEIPSLRMVFCGSLGLHIVLGKLRETGYSGRPVNDMPAFEVPPLGMKEAAYLAGCLLLGEKVACSDRHEVAREIAEASSAVPFYIQHIVEQMAQAGDTWTPETTGGVPHALFNAPGDPLEFLYYDQRLDQYYPLDTVEKSRAALDILSQRAEGMGFDELVNLIRHRPKTATVDSEEMLKILRVLLDDHYVVRTDDHWAFKLEIVRQWWHGARGRLAL